MAERLVDIYHAGDKVEITFDGLEWWAGRVLGPDHPGVWVRSIDGRLWFVTNRRRIKKISQDGDKST
jgi:hypothetical protein